MKNKALKIVLGVLLAAAVVVGLCFGVQALIQKTSETPTETPAASPADTVESGTVGTEVGTEPATAEPTEEPITEEMLAAMTKEVYTVDDIQGDDPRFDLTVASCGDYTLTNRQAQVYYFMQYFGFMSNYGAYASYFGLDTSKPLSQQESIAGELTWEQYFLMAGMDQFHQFAAVATKAKAEGYTLPEEDSAYLEEILAGMPEEAAQYGYESVDEYIQASFGAGVNFAQYEEYLRLYFLAMSYQNSLYDGITWTDDDLKAYYDAHPENFDGIDTETPNINVRHILFLTDADDDGTVTEEENAAAKEKAEALLEEFRKNPSEEAFAALANEHSEDPGSNTNGGLYEGVYPGQMVDTFNDWCFDAARQSGDTDIVVTSYGYHVMYFVEKTGEYQWKVIAEQNYAESVLNEQVDEIVAGIPAVITYEDVILTPIPQDEEG